MADPSPISRDYPVFGTAPGRPAFGADDEVSRFTRALLLTLHGAGWDDRRLPWLRLRHRRDGRDGRGQDDSR